jgi:hypothetical protein
LGPPPLSSARPQPLLHWPAIYVASGAALLLAAGFVVALALSTPARSTDGPKAVAQAPSEPILDEDRPQPSTPPPVPSEPKQQPVEKEKAPPAPRIVQAPVKVEQPKTLEERVRPPTSLLGTTVEFVDNPVAAARTAAREDKLLYVLHVSGNFEDPDFT